MTLETLLSKLRAKMNYPVTVQQQGNGWLFTFYNRHVFVDDVVVKANRQFIMDNVFFDWLIRELYRFVE